MNGTESKKKEVFNDIDDKIDGLESSFDIDYVVNYFDTYMFPKFKKGELREALLDSELVVLLDKREDFKHYPPKQLEFEDRLSKIPVNTYDDDFI